MKNRLLLFIALIPVYNFSQSGKVQLEFYTAAHRVFHVNCHLEDKSVHSGFTMSPGLRLNVDLTNKFALVGAFTKQDMIGDNTKFYPEGFFRLDVKYRIGHFRFLKWIDFTAETGIDYRTLSKKIGVPFYAGAEFHVNPTTDWTLRFASPSLNSFTDSIGTFAFARYGVEVGVSKKLCCRTAPKYACGGNPWILL